MKVIKQVLVILVITLLASGCDVVAEKPSSDIMKQALLTELGKTGVPTTWTKESFPGTKPIITHFRTEEWGAYDSEHKRWPVKARVVGSAKGPALIAAGKYPFDLVVDFYIFKDDFGEWKSKIIY